LLSWSLSGLVGQPRQIRRVPPGDRRRDDLRNVVAVMTTQLFDQCVGAVRGCLDLHSPFLLRLHFALPAENTGDRPDELRTRTEPGPNGGRSQFPRGRLAVG